MQDFNKSGFRKISDLKAQAMAKALNVGLLGALKSKKWTPSQRKLIKIMVIMNELEGPKGKEVLELGLVQSAANRMVAGGNTNEIGARPYIDRIQAVVEGTDEESK